MDIDRVFSKPGNFGEFLFWPSQSKTSEKLRKIRQTTSLVRPSKPFIVFFETTR